jgi:hypothetical protein
MPSGTTILRCGPGFIGAQLLAGGDDAVGAGGVVGVGGACALAIAGAATIRHERKSAWFMLMRGKRRAQAEVPEKKAVVVHLPARQRRRFQDLR